MFNNSITGISNEYSFVDYLDGKLFKNINILFQDLFLNLYGNIDENEMIEYIEIPPNSQMGDFSFPCFKLAKELKKSPMQIAQDIKDKYELDDEIEKIDIINGYLNFYRDMYNSYLDHAKKFTIKNTTIERINNDGNYQFDNCKWATRQEQLKNTRRSRRSI